MASFKTNMQEWSGGFAPPSPVTAPKNDPWGELAAKLVPGMLDAVGKGYAQAKGANILGGATSAEEAQTAVVQFEEAVPFSDAPSKTPDQKAQIEDMKAAALKKYGTNDKKLQALVSAGKISALEANARRHQMIQENLSNPVLAMFKDEFMEASVAFTGGPGLTEKFFGAYMPTEEERVRMAMIDETVKNRVAFEGQVQQVSQIYNISPEASAKLIKHRAEQDDYLKQKEAEHKLRTFSSAESYTVAMGHVDKITADITNNLSAMVASGQKFSDPSQILASIQQARTLGAMEIAKYGNTMTTEDRRSAEGELNKRLDDLSSMVTSADGHEYAMRHIALVKGRVAAREAAATSQLMDAMRSMWIVHKEAPDLAKMIMGAAAGDKAAEFELAVHPYAKDVAKKLGIDTDKNREEELPKVGGKIVQGDTEFNVKEAVLAVSSIFTGSSEGVKAEVEVATKQPDVHEALLQTAFKTLPDADVLSKYANASEWIRAAKTPEGAKTVANAIATRVSQARALQMRTGDIPSGKIVVREVAPNPKEAPGRSPFYEFHTPGIDPAVQKDMMQVMKIMRNSPLVTKELGVQNAEEYLNKFFLKP